MTGDIDFNGITGGTVKLTSTHTLTIDVEAEATDAASDTCPVPITGTLARQQGWPECSSPPDDKEMREKSLLVEHLARRQQE